MIGNFMRSMAQDLKLVHTVREFFYKVLAK